jgi:cytidylate kinase
MGTWPPAAIRGRGSPSAIDRPPLDNQRLHRQLTQEISEVPKTIAISRQRGSGGAYVGRKIAEHLSLRYIDRELLRHAAEYLCAHREEQLEAVPASWLDRLGRAFAFGDPGSASLPPASEALYEGELFEMETRLVQEIAEAQDSVVVGRGAAQTLRGRPGVLSVFLHAPEQWRVDRVQRIYQIADRRAAERMVLNSDRDRTRFVHALGGPEWTDARAYEIALDTAAIGLDAAVDLIVRTVAAQA